MKVKSGKIIKICALSLGLLMLGGATITPITKVYAESGQQDHEEISWRFKITYTKGNSEFNGVWLWKNKEEGHFVPFKTDDTGNRYIDTIIKCKTGDTIGYIICKYGTDSDGKNKILKKDESEKNGGEGISKNDRTVTVSGEGTGFSLSEGNAEPQGKEDIKPTIAQKIEVKQLPTKPIKVWKDAKINWKDAIDESKIRDDDVKKVLKDGYTVKDLGNRNSNYASSFTKDGNLKSKDGKVEVTFNDGSSVQVDTKLYVSDLITAATNTNAPEGAIDIELKLGDDVKVVESDKTEHKGPKSYRYYKAKPGINIFTDKLASNKTILDYVPAVPTESGKKVKWINKAGNEEYKVSNENKSFTAIAIDQTIIRINYHRPDKKIDGWKVMIYYGNSHVYSQPFDKKDDKGNYYAEVSLDGKLESVSYMVYKDSGEVEKNGTSDKDGKRTLKIKDGKGEARVEAKKEKDKKPQKPATPDSPKKPLVPSVRPSYSRSLDYKIVPEKKTEKKIKPSEKVIKSYKNLRVSREKNVVVVKAAKLLLEIAPERVKDVETNLINLIAKSEGLVKQADTILEKLEAKYEF